MTKQNIIQEKTLTFALNIVALYKQLCNDGEYVLSKQLLRSGTSIGANVRESINAQSSNDFISKANIALKEADETAYWLELLYKSGYIDKTTYDNANKDITEIIMILTSIVKTTKNNINNK